MTKQLGRRWPNEGKKMIEINHGFDVEMQFYNQRVSKARKSYKCDECDERIEKSQKYEKISGKCDGEFFVNKTCLLCAEIREKLTEGSALGNLYDDIKNELDYGEIKLDNLSVEAKEKLSPEAFKKFEFMVINEIEWSGHEDSIEEESMN